jgi:adenosylmethionine-8-amino-7-oxononanoate aminotransferase
MAPDPDPGPVPMADTQRLQELAKQHLMLHFSDMSVDSSEITVIESGEGYHVFDSEGNRYIDGLSGLYCANLGHSHGEEIGAVAAEQLQHETARIAGILLIIGL